MLRQNPDIAGILHGCATVFENKMNMSHEWWHQKRSDDL